MTDVDPLSPRRFAADFGASMPKHWCGGNPVLTHILDTYSLIAPGSESYIIRTLKECLPSIHDAQLRERLEQLLAQEGQHAVGHHRLHALIEKQGYAVEKFQSRLSGFMYRFVEPLISFKVRVAKVACSEHINAYFGMEFLQQDLLRDADPTLRALNEWHFAEEMQHKSVAFDVLQAISPSYFVRLAGALLVFPRFYSAMTVNTLAMLRRDGLLAKRATWRLLREHLFSRHHMARRVLGHVRDYLRPSFHPSQRDDSELARRTLARLTEGAAAPVRAVDTTAPAKVPPRRDAGTLSCVDRLRDVQPQLADTARDR